jgi:hypothetical protein
LTSDILSLHCSGDGRVVLVDSAATKEAIARGVSPPMPAVNLDLEKVKTIPNANAVTGKTT